VDNYEIASVYCAMFHLKQKCMLKFICFIDKVLVNIAVINCNNLHEVAVNISVTSVKVTCC